ncbi:hypothetical protein DFJ43DRAFT_1077566 [Lentinula guzmanii]|uniref:DUF8040 domain-containing protein n=1 Tax=Lentinula guzmanii TaxID=2804957 RepID=A0AA38JJK0_9AGAR|nr:hypothetical protein DFJ43DRAFT_1077566 [Lentinula guzmanii]
MWTVRLLSRHILLEEKIAIFLYTCVTGLSVCHVSEQFQCSNDTIAKYFKQGLTGSVVSTSNVEVLMVAFPVVAVVVLVSVDFFEGSIFSVNLTPLFCGFKVVPGVL